jgi:hypothetical protein
VELVLGALVIAQHRFELVGSVHQGLPLGSPERFAQLLRERREQQVEADADSSSLMLASTECFSKAGNIRNAPLRLGCSKLQRLKKDFL